MIIYSELMPETWDSVNNLFGGQAQATMLPSGFFPAPQALQPIRSEIAQPALSLGVPRLTATDAPSLAETAAWASDDWMRSPYEAELSISARSPALAGAPPIQTLATDSSWWEGFARPWELAGESLYSTLEDSVTGINKQLPEILMRKIGLVPEREVVNTQGDTIYNIYQMPDKAQATIPGLKQEQPKGLFGVGYEPTVLPTVVPIARPSTAALGISPILILLGLFLFAK